MALVTQCDVCNNVVKNEQSFCVTLASRNSKGTTVACIFAGDICSECKRKLLKSFGIEEDEE